jgi:hypothetical protein
MEAGVTPFAGGYHQTTGYKKATYSKIPSIDFTDNPDCAVGAKIATHDHQSLENARESPLLQFMTSGTRLARSKSLSSTANPNITRNLPMTPTFAPQPA